jgi:L-asparagine oxygenase
MTVGVHRLDDIEIITVTPHDGTRLYASAREIVDELATDRGTERLDVVEQAAGLITVIPAALVRAVHRFRNHGSPHNALLVRDLLPELVGLAPTPATTTPSDAGAVSDAASVILLAVASLLGESFTFASLYEGRLVQHVTPVPGREAAQTSEGSDSVLGWHVEDAFTEDRCDHFGLLCLRGAPEAVTLLAPARSLRLPSEVEQVLREPRFVVAPDTAHLNGSPSSTDVTLPRVPVLSGPPHDPEICFDAIYQRPAEPLDSEAAAGLAMLAAAVEDAVVRHVLAPGELLIADNRRVVHGRTVFRPRYDGEDRWLLRTMVCASIRAHRRRGAVRALI